MKKTLPVFFILLLASAPLNGSLAREPQTVYVRGDNQLPQGYTHASFKGGDLLDFKVWVSLTLQFPPEVQNEETTGRVIVSFVVDENGIPTDLEALTSPGLEYSRAVIQTIASSSGSWEPGTDPDGTPVRIRYLLPVEIVDNDFVYDGMKDLPRGFSHAQFNGQGVTEFEQWIKSNVEYPEGYLEGNYGFNQIYASYIIGKKGFIEEVEFLLTPGDSVSVSVFDAMRASSGMWTPATDEKGNPVRVMYNLHITNNRTGEGKPDAAGLPKFKGGDLQSFRDWVQKRIQYPPEAAEVGISGRVISTFVIDRDGKLIDIQILYSPHKMFSNVVTGVLRPSPKWQPGRDPDGQPVKVRFVLPIYFLFK